MTASRRVRVFVAVGLLVTVLLAGVVSSLASSSPDGLERVAIDKGFDETAQDHAFSDGPVADYSVRGVDNDNLSTGMAGLIGVAVTFVITGTAVLVMRRVRRQPASARA